MKKMSALYLTIHKFLQELVSPAVKVDNCSQALKKVLWQELHTRKETSSPFFIFSA